MRIALIQSSGANFLSLELALKRLNVEYILTNDKNIVRGADAVILPGVGAASFAMQNLIKYDLVSTICNLKQPLLGICLGMQLLYESSEEDGNVSCLGVIPGKVTKFNAKEKLIIPHMGWHNMNLKLDDPIISGIHEADDVYFVHSYFAPVSKNTIASCEYGQEFSAIVKYNNFYGMQFHPEKSGSVGSLLLFNFINMIGKI